MKLQIAGQVPPADPIITLSLVQTGDYVNLEASNGSISQTIVGVLPNGRLSIPGYISDDLGLDTVDNRIAIETGYGEPSFRTISR